MQLFYSPDISPAALCTLDAEESRHAVRVLRMRTGDPIHVADGRGTRYRCRIVEADERACVVEPVEAAATAAGRPQLTLAVAPTKNPSRMEWLVEKAVEMGVGTIALLQCDHSERTFLKTDRLQRLALSAMKQSLRASLPVLVPATPLSEWLHATATDDQALRLIAHCEAGQPRRPLAEALTPGRDAVILIGPEGDFSTDEIELALHSGFQPVSFGDARLRTETAALYAVAAFNLANSLSESEKQ